LSPSAVKQRAQSTVTELASHFDDPKPQKDDISSSYFCSFSNPLDASTNETFLSSDLAGGPEYENELTVDRDDENDTKSAPNSPPSLSSLRVCRRLQRQLNSQFLYTHARVKAISEQIEEMVSTKSQCNVTTPSVTSQPPSQIAMLESLEADDNILPDRVDDEGYCEGAVEDDEVIDAETLMMDLRRASAPSRIKSDGYVKGMVFARPRMRRKILRRKRVETRAETGT
jgi:hypothetical protein